MTLTFEDRYVAWLNHGHLPPGLHAELAHSATNPAWDIAVKDQAGHVDRVLQLKASHDLGYVRSALESHPNVDVVVPHDVYHQLAQHGELSAHLLDSNQTLHDLNGHVGAAVGHAAAVHAAPHIPVLAVAFAVGHSFYAYRAGHIPLEQAVRLAAERSGLAVVATGAGTAASVLLHSTGWGIPVAILARLLGARVLKNVKLRSQIDDSCRRCAAAQAAMQRRIARGGPRPGLAAGSPPDGFAAP
ncbi:MAG TPA: hypothetical protein VNF74_09690 [Terriglobales bacterium]|nr:hypothetical protein [Terriglobales bacterium]